MNDNQWQEGQQGLFSTPQSQRPAQANFPGNSGQHPGYPLNDQEGPGQFSQGYPTYPQSQGYGQQPPYGQYPNSPAGYPSGGQGGYPPAQPPKSNFKMVMGLLIGIGVLLLAGIFYFLFFKGSGSSPEDTIQILEDAYNELDYDKMLTCMTETGKQDLEQGLASGMFMYAKDWFDQYSRELQEGGQPITVDFQIASISPEKYTDKDRIIVTVSALGKRGSEVESAQLDFNMVNEGGKWLIIP